MLLGKFGLIFKLKSISSNSVKRNVEKYVCYQQQKTKEINSYFIRLGPHSHSHSEIRGHPPSLMKVNIVFIGQNADKFVSIVGLTNF